MLGHKKNCLNKDIFSPTRPSGPSWSESRHVRVCVCGMSPSHAIYFEASHWPSGHMIRSRSLIGPSGHMIRSRPRIDRGGKNKTKNIFNNAKKQVNHEITSNLYWAYYSHRSRELVSPVNGIFNKLKNCKKKKHLPIKQRSKSIEKRQQFSLCCLRVIWRSRM